MILYFLAAIVIVVCAQRVTPFSRAAAIALVASPLLFTGPALVTRGVYGPLDLAYTSEPLASIAAANGVRSVKNPAISDVYAQFWPWRDAVRKSIARGEWPLWNPYELCGEPLAGAAQSSPYHPFTLIALLAPIAQSFAVVAALTMLAAIVSAFLLLRDLVESELAALFGAFAWMASTHLVFFAGTALVLAASVTPLVLLGARRVARQPSRKSGAILTIALLLVVLAGHPESALHIVTFGVVYFFFERPAGRRAIVAGFASGIAALLLSAFFLLPLFEAIPQSEEYVHRAESSARNVSTASQVSHLVAIEFFPYLEGATGVEERPHTPATAHGWTPTAYAGGLLFAPALFALFRSPSRERWFFLAAIVWGLAAAVSAPGFTQLLAHLPGFALAVNDRMVAFATLGICGLAAIGLDRADERLARWFAVCVVVMALVGLLVPTGLLTNYVRVAAARAIMPVALAACAMLVMPRRTALLMLVALLMLQRVGEDLRLQPTLRGRTFYPTFPGASILRGDQPFRIVGSGSIFTPEVPTHYGLEDARGYQALTLYRYWQTYPLWCKAQPVWSNRVDRLDAPMLSAMNVRFAIVDPSVAIPPSWMVRARFPAYEIVENTRVLPRAFVPRTISAVASADASLATMYTISDFGAKSVVEDGRPATGPNGPGVVSIHGDRLHASMAGPGWVIVSNANWKGWRATENGRAIPLRFGNHAFLALYLGAGEHDVELRYRPRSFVIGGWISLAALVAVLAYTAIPSSAITFFMSFQTSFFAEGVRNRYAG